MEKFNTAQDIYKRVKPVIKGSYIRKKDAVQRYFPGHTVATARRYMNWAIKGDMDLCIRLSRVGFFLHRRCKYYTRSEMELFDEMIGVPDE